MRISSRVARIALLTLAFCVILAGSLLIAYRTHSEGLKASRYESMDGWQAISGRWNENAGVLSNSNYGRGDMLSHSIRRVPTIVFPRIFALICCFRNALRRRRSRDSYNRSATGCRFLPGLLRRPQAGRGDRLFLGERRTIGTSLRLRNWNRRFRLVRGIGLNFQLKAARSLLR